MQPYVLMVTCCFYLFLLCWFGVFSCTVVAATSGLCNKTETLSPADLRRTLIRWTVPEYLWLVCARLYVCFYAGAQTFVLIQCEDMKGVKYL